MSQQPLQFDQDEKEETMEFIFLYEKRIYLDISTEKLSWQYWLFIQSHVLSETWE